MQTRDDRGEMVPIGSMMSIKESYGPDPVLRYNKYHATNLSVEVDALAQSEAAINAGMAAICKTWAARAELRADSTVASTDTTQ
ncbi:hypothetical protein ACMHYO_08665 [Allopusillimonas ginsengisoli]|uniref:hypothetical protein n=1 Tax=Allopusillimonas ginsengisoli TaxID=453575 RepID=UPI0039C1F170